MSPLQSIGSDDGLEAVTLIEAFLGRLSSFALLIRRSQSLGRSLRIAVQMVFRADTLFCVLG